MSWASKRQFLYFAGALFVFIVVLALPTFFLVYTPPTCSDKIQNQGELGVDCGGPCSILCKADALDIIVHWQRAFKVKDGVYNALAYVENPNLNSGVSKLVYRFKFYDSDNILISERKGETFIPPNKIFGVFESNITTGSRVPARTIFEFLDSPVWQKNFSQDPVFLITNKLLFDKDNLPRLTASLENHTTDAPYSVEVVAILYDATGNAVAVSKTVVDSPAKDSSVPLIFTWPEQFGTPVVRTELTYRVVPSNSF